MSTLLLGEFALRLTIAFRDWTSPKKEAAAAYFSGDLTRHGGDELGVRTSLVKDRILQIGFGFEPGDIQIEASDRADVVLYAGSAADRRPVAIVETKKSGFGDLLKTIHSGGETPAQQLERYVRRNGLHLGVLTNGDWFHLIDFGVSIEPRASFSLKQLTDTLAPAADSAGAEKILDAHPDLKNAVLIAQTTLAATKWKLVDHYLAEINSPGQFHSNKLLSANDRQGLVENIKRELAILRDTTLAQFALLHARAEEYSRISQQVDETDPASFQEALQSARQKLQEAVPAAAQEPFGKLLDRLVADYLTTGDMDAFFANFYAEGQVLATDYRQQMTLAGDAAAVAPLLASAKFSLPSPSNGLIELLNRHYRYQMQLDQLYASSIRLMTAYDEWQRRVRGTFSSPEKEFCLQTSYVHFIRLFFVRVCEDYRIISRRLSNGPFTRFDEYRISLLHGVSDVYNRLLIETFERAASVYHNFFARGEMYDWFKLDERAILGILAVLNRYDFSQIDFDVLGAIYNQGYIEEKNRSERGQFYTPHQAVLYILDSLGIPKPEAAGITDAERGFIAESAIDISCGSGSFLVEVAGRKAAILQKMVAAKEVSCARAVEYITDTLVGLDINPFACYLAEINLLVRCMPFIRKIRKEDLPAGAPESDLVVDGAPCTIEGAESIKRLNIFCADSLEPTQREIIQLKLAEAGGNAPKIQPARSARLSDEEQAARKLKDDKTAPGRFAKAGAGFGYVFGNPPYVRADESLANREYRDKIRGWEFYRLYQKWDLFVPFVYRSLQFLAANGRLGLITSNALETEGYAATLRTDLGRYRLEQVDFFPKIKLFQDAAVHNTIFILSGQPDPNPQVSRRIHQDDSFAAFADKPLPQTEGADIIFRHTHAPQPPGIDTCAIPFCAIAYVGTGIVAHSHEKFDQIVAGQRKRLFDLSESFRETIDDLPPDQKEHFRDYGVVGDDVEDYHVSKKRYVAYDHLKSKFYRARVPELFRTPEKLLFGRTSGGFYDRASLFASDSVRLAVPWHALTGVEEPGLKKVRSDSESLSGYSNLSELSTLFDLRYVLAALNSDFLRDYMMSNQIKGTRGEIYPDVLKAMPVKVVSTETQTGIGAMVDEIQALYLALAGLPGDEAVFAEWKRTHPHPKIFNDYIISGQVKLLGALNETRKAPYEPDGNKVILHGKSDGLEAKTGAELPLLEYFCWYCNAIEPHLRGRRWEELREQIITPDSLPGVIELLAARDAARNEIAQRRKDIESKKAGLETAVIAAYAEGGDETLWAKVQAYRAQPNGQISLLSDDDAND